MSTVRIVLGVLGVFGVCGAVAAKADSAMTRQALTAGRWAKQMGHLARRHSRRPRWNGA